MENTQNKEQIGTNDNRNQQQNNQDLKEFFSFKEVFGYFFRKKDPSRPTNFNLKMMHGINKISIVMFLLGMLFFIIKHLF